jgi:hypothetical protein
MIVKIYQYKAGPDGKWLDDAISIWTKPFNWNTPNYSHSEIAFPYSDELADWVNANQKMDMYLPLIKGEDIFFSSTMRQNNNGTRFASSSEILTHPERWDKYVKDYPEEEVLKMIERAKSIINHKYFLAGIFFDFLIPFRTISQYVSDKFDEWYCSMSVWYTLIGERRRVSPRRLTPWILKIKFLLNPD